MPHDLFIYLSCHVSQRTYGHEDPEKCNGQVGTRHQSVHVECYDASKYSWDSHNYFNNLEETFVSYSTLNILEGNVLPCATNLKFQLTEYALRSRVGKIGGLISADLWHDPGFRKLIEVRMEVRTGRKVNKHQMEKEKQSITWTNVHTHLPAAAAVICRASWQDDGAGHQHLQQNHQDEVKVDLRADRVGAWKDT